VLLRRALRLLGAALAAGLIAGAVTGLASRGLMWFIGELAPGRAGDVTHENAVVGQRTLGGTLNVVIQGAAFGMPFGAFVYLAVRRWVPGRGVWRGLVFGAFVLMMMGGVVLDGGYEYFRYASAAVTVPLFASLFFVYGVVAVPLTERWAGPSPWPSRHWVTVGGRIALGALFVMGALHFRDMLSDVYHLL
jgi:hypothetical protein